MNFCRSKRWDPLHPKDTQFLSCLHHLRVSRHLSGQSLAGYKAAIVSTIELARGIDNPHFARSVLVKHYIDGVRNVTSSLERKCPQWDIFVVLKYVRDVLEPLVKLTLKQITYKTLFCLLWPLLDG